MTQQQILSELNEELEMVNRDLEAAERALSSGEINQKEYNRDVAEAESKLSVIEQEIKRVSK